MKHPIISRLRHRKEALYGAFMSVIGFVIWAVIIVVAVAALLSPAHDLVFVAYAIGLGLFVMISAALYRAHAFGHFVLVGPAQFPHLYNMVQEGASRIGLQPAPTAFVYNSNGLLNAFARRIFGGRFIFLTSALVDAETDEQVKFVIGHELGHHAAGHLNFWKHLLQLPAHLVPFLGPAYSRSRELTCDRFGAYLSEDVQASKTALQMLACGCRRLNSSLNCEAFEAQEQLVPPFWGWVSLIFSRYPRTTQRVIAVAAFFGEEISDRYDGRIQAQQSKSLDGTIMQN